MKHNHLEKHVEKRYRERDRKKRKRMKVSGKSVFTLQKLIDKSHKKSP